MLASTVLLLVAISIGDALSLPTQVSLQVPAIRPQKLHGRFLHITDMHPDPYYKPHTSKSKACHRKKPKKAKKESGYYGTPYSDCDSPFILTNFTLDFLDKHWSSELDFVIWTGDNARHDNDQKLPRTPQEIYDLNRAVAAKMKKIFTNRGIPVVPSLGNNDVWPHNIMTPGPNSITLEFSSIWKSFIPFPFLQVFHRGAYYSKEVIPDQVAAISLNTMYFYDSNKAVGGCGFKDPEDPGNLQFDWLEVQLKSYRERGMQVWLTGHVPPSPGNYFPECYVRYVELSLRFQDTILGHLFGHMNVDHFSFLEAVDLQIVPGEDEPTGQRQDLYDILIQEYAALPRKSKDIDFGNYAIINVAPSVVPNPYLPSFRVFAYNISAGDNVDTKTKKGSKRKHGHRRGDHGDKASYCRTEIYRDTWKCYLNESWHSDPESPSRSNKLWTPLGYAQYYVPDLKVANKTHEPHFKLEYITLPASHLYPPPSAGPESQDFIYPIPVRHLPQSLRNSNVTSSKYTPYSMKDLTIPSWIELGQELGDEKKNKKVRKRYRRYMYMEG